MKGFYIGQDLQRFIKIKGEVRLGGDSQLCPGLEYQQREHLVICEIHISQIGERYLCILIELYGIHCSKLSIIII